MTASVDVILQIRPERNPDLKLRKALAASNTVLVSAAEGTGQNMVITHGEKLMIVDDPVEQQVLVEVRKMYRALQKAANGG